MTMLDTPARSPPPPTGTTSASNEGSCSASSRPTVEGAVDRMLTLERVDAEPPLVPRDLLHAGEPARPVIGELDLGAEAPAAGDARRVGGGEHHDPRARARGPGRVGHGDGVVPRADRRYAARQRGRTRAEHVVERPPHLVGAGALEQLQLEEALGPLRQPHRPGVGNPAAHRRAVDPRRDAGSRLAAGCGRWSKAVGWHVGLRGRSAGAVRPAMRHRPERSRQHTCLTRARQGAILCRHDEHPSDLWPVLFLFPPRARRPVIV